MRRKWPFKLYVSPVLTQNQHIWNFHGSLTPNNGKLILYFRSPCFAFCLLFRIREKIECFKLCVTPVLTQKPDIRNFHSSLTLNNGKLIGYFRSPWYAIVLKVTHFLIRFAIEKKMTFFELCVLPVLTQNQCI